MGDFMMQCSLLNTLCLQLKGTVQVIWIKTDFDQHTFVCEDQPGPQINKTIAFLQRHKNVTPKTIFAYLWNLLKIFCLLSFV